MANAQHLTGYLYYLKGDYSKCLNHWKKTLSIRKERLEKIEVDTSLAKDTTLLKEAGKEIASSYNNIGLIYEKQGDYDKAIEYHLQSKQIKQDMGDKQGMAASYNNIGILYKNRSKFDKALEYYLKSLKLYEEAGDKKGMATACNNAGIIHKTQGLTAFKDGNTALSKNKYKKAMEYYRKSLGIREDIGGKKGMADTYSNMGAICKNQGHMAYKEGNMKLSVEKYKKAMKFHRKSLKIRSEMNDINSLGVSYINLGSLYATLYEKDTASGNFSIKNELNLDHGTVLDSAKHYYQKSYEIHKSIGDPMGLVYSLSGLGEVLYRQNRFRESIVFYEKAKAYADSIGAEKEYYISELGLANSNEELGNFRHALEHHREYARVKDKVNSQKSSEKIAEMEAKFKNEERRREIEVLEKEKEKQAAVSAEKERRQHIIIASISIGLILVITFAGFIFNRLRVTRNQKKVIQLQKEVVQEKNNEIIDSINYARRLQEAILPPKALVRELLEDSFILYKPKDIVAGDFYWMEKIENKIYFAVADCTGHGVPGAMVSVVCSNALSKTLLEEGIKDPAKILDRTRELVIERFKKSEEEVKDGMDIALFSLEPDAKNGFNLKYSGANIPLWIIRNDKNEIVEIKPNKQPVGKFLSENPFTEHSLELQKGDILYAFSDGFPDQFGGEKGKKYKKGPMKTFLLSVKEKDMPTQGLLLNNEFEEWRNDLEQVDDVCVFGMRL